MKSFVVAALASAALGSPTDFAACTQDTDGSADCGCFDQWTFEGCVAELLEWDWSGKVHTAAWSAANPSGPFAYYPHGDGVNLNSNTLSAGATLGPVKLLDSEQATNFFTVDVGTSQITGISPNIANSVCWRYLVDEEVYGAAPFPDLDNLDATNLCMAGGVKGACYEYAEAMNTCAIQGKCQLDCQSNRWAAQTMMTYIAESTAKCTGGAERFEPDAKLFANNAYFSWPADDRNFVDKTANPAGPFSFDNAKCTKWGDGRQDQKLGENGVTYNAHAAPNGKRGAGQATNGGCNFDTGVGCCDRTSTTGSGCGVVSPSAGNQWACADGPKAAVGGKTGCAAMTIAGQFTWSSTACVHTCDDGYTPNTFTGVDNVKHPTNRGTFPNSPASSATVLYCGLSIWTDPVVSVADGGYGYPQDRTPKWVGGGVPTCTPATCAPLDAVANSDVTSAVSGKTTTETVVVQCNDGFSGGGTATCSGESGATTAAWTGTSTCAAATCAPLDAVANSDVSSPVSGKKTTETVVVACNPGFTGTATATCSGDAGAATAAWTGVPTCTAIPCTTAGYTGTAGSCTCAGGYEGTVTYTAGVLGGCNMCAGGSWVAAGNGLTCAAVDCAPTGYTGTAGSCTCDTGYHGSVTYTDGALGGCTACSTTYTDVSIDTCDTCDDSGCLTATCATNYDPYTPGNPGSCATVANKCAAYTFSAPVVKPASGGCTSGTALAAGSSCTVECATGYVAQTVTISCDGAAAQDDATSGSITCAKTQCTAPPGAPTDGSITTAATAGNDHESQITFACSAGFEMTGAATITCAAPTADAAWPSAPTCGAVACPAGSTGSVPTGCTCPPGAANNIAASTSSPFYTGSCSAVGCPGSSTGTSVESGCTCDQGWTGSVTASTASPWYSTQCTEIAEYCAAVSTSCAGAKLGATCNVACGQGYTAAAATSTCNYDSASSGTWSPAPACNANPCTVGTLGNGVSGDVTGPSVKACVPGADALTSGQSCDVKCQNGFFPDAGTTTSSCSLGELTAATVACTADTCAENEFVSNNQCADCPEYSTNAEGDMTNTNSVCEGCLFGTWNMYANPDSTTARIVGSLSFNSAVPSWSLALSDYPGVPANTVISSAIDMKEYLLSDVELSIGACDAPQKVELVKLDDACGFRFKRSNTCSDATTEIGLIILQSPSTYFACQDANCDCACKAPELGAGAMATPTVLTAVAAFAAWKLM